MNKSYHYIKEEDYDKKIKTKEYSCLSYYSKAMMKKKYPTGGYIVVGCVGDNLKVESNTFEYNGEELRYYKIHFSKVKYGIVGYVALGNDEYLAVVKNVLFRNLICAILSIGIICGLIFGLVMLVIGDGIDSNAKDYTPPEGVNVETDPNHIALPGYGDIILKAGSDTAYVALWNPPNNPCYFEFTFTLKDTGKVIYKSGLVPPGKAITTARLNQKIEKGSYKLSIGINTYSLEDKETKLNNGVIETTLKAVDE